MQLKETLDFIFSQKCLDSVNNLTLHTNYLGEENEIVVRLRYVFQVNNTCDRKKLY